MKTTGLVLDVINQRGGPMPSTTTLYDRSRFKNHGTMTNATWNQTSSGLWASRFVGTGNVSFGKTFQSIGCVRDCSVLLWARSDVPAAYSSPFGSAVPGSNRVDVFTEASIWKVCVGTVGPTYAYINLPAVSSVFQFLCLTYDGTNLIGSLNGVSAPAQAISGNLLQTDNIYVGQLGNNGVFWSGDVALVRILTYALLPAQIRALYNVERRLFGV